MEYQILGSVLAVLISMKFSVYKSKEQEKKIEAMEAKIALMEEDMPKKVMTTIIPLTQAVKKVNAQLGL